LHLLQQLTHTQLEQELVVDLLEPAAKLVERVDRDSLLLKSTTNNGTSA
jgi:hypothetical protein